MIDLPAFSSIAGSKFSPNQTMCGLNKPPQPGFLQCGRDFTGISEPTTLTSGAPRPARAWNVYKYKLY